jgi:hypothetical protein
MALAAKAHLAEGQLRRLKSTLNKVKSERFRTGTRKPTVLKRFWQNFESLYTLSKNKTGNVHTYKRNIQASS